MSEPDLLDAVRFLAAEVGLVVEGAGSASVAAVRAGRVGPGTGPTVVVVTGRNFDRKLLASILSGSAAGADGAGLPRAAGPPTPRGEVAMVVTQR